MLRYPGLGARSIYPLRLPALAPQAGLRCLGRRAASELDPHALDIQGDSQDKYARLPAGPIASILPSNGVNGYH
jgi:hypothetical protein